jgi:hypothetical protein
MSKKTKQKILLVKEFFNKKPYLIYFFAGSLLVLIFPPIFKYLVAAAFGFFTYDKASSKLVAKKAHAASIKKDKEIIDSLRQDIANQQASIEEPINTNSISNEQLDALENNFLFSKKDSRDD